MRVIQIGNFEPEHSTENHLALALEANGVEVIKMQENNPATFLSLAYDGDNPIVFADWVLWTRTGWDWDRIFPGGEAGALAAQRRFLRMARAIGIPVIAYHLDIWFGLGREHQLAEPFFDSSTVITADGGHDEQFARLGIRHCWMPPGVARTEAEPGRFDPEMHSKIAFVGSWQGGYHQEHQHRFELVDWLRKNYRQHCEFWPRLGQPAVRGEALRNLYASVDVVVGDSCFAGSGLPNYWSDRIPETLGRGGFLLHPDVPGLREHFPLPTLETWEAGDWDALGEKIEYFLANPGERATRARLGREHVLAHHTYDVRMRHVIELLRSQEWL